jgi:acyl-CoA oxidase
VSSLVAVTLRHEGVTETLARALRRGPLSTFEKQLIALLQHEIFGRREGLTTRELCTLSYQRFRYLHTRLDLSIANVFSDLRHLLALHEWVCLVDGTLTTLMTIHFNLCIGSILQLGGGRSELQPLIEELDRLETVGVFLATELGYGNNVQSLETEARYDHSAQEFILHTPAIQAQKFMPNTGADGVPKLAVVMARLKIGAQDCGVFPFIVRIRTMNELCDGVRVTLLGEKPDYALDNAVTSFDSVRVPRSQWLSGSDSWIDEGGRFHSSINSRARRFFSAMNRVQSGKLCLGFSALGFLRGSVQVTMRYAQQRNTFGPGRSDVSILYYSSYRRALFEAIATSYAATFLMQHARDAYHSRSHAENLATNRSLAIAKTFTSSRAQRITGMCRERVGAQGLFLSNRIISYWIQTSGIVTAEGDNEVLLVKTARELLFCLDYEPPKASATVDQSLAELPLRGLVALVAGHERCMHQTISAAISGGTRATFSQAWNTNLPRAIELASVYGVRVALECFLAALESVDEPQARGVLERLFRLFAVAEIASFSSDMLLEGVLDRTAAASLNDVRGQLSSELVEFANHVVDAYGMPDALLGAPISNNYLAAYDFLSVKPAAHSGFITVQPNSERGDRSHPGAEHAEARTGAIID